MRWTAVSTVETMIADSLIVQREQFLADMTTHCATVCLPLLFRQRFHGHVGGYDIFHAMCQIIELLREPHYTAFIATEVIQYCVVAWASYVIAYAKRFMPLIHVRRRIFLGFCLT